MRRGALPPSGAEGPPAPPQCCGGHGTSPFGWPDPSSPAHANPNRATTQPPESSCGHAVLRDRCASRRAKGSAALPPHVRLRWTQGASWPVGSWPNVVASHRLTAGSAPKWEPVTVMCHHAAKLLGRGLASPRPHKMDAGGFWASATLVAEAHCSGAHPPRASRRPPCHTPT